MPAIGITGGIATGKSAFSARLRERVPAIFFDADTAARELTDRDLEVQSLIREQFGHDIYSAAGDLNRARVRSIVFADPGKRLALEQILHPRIRRQWSEQAERYRNSQDLFFADIPLLYETEGETLCDRIVVVACSAQIQLARLMNRMQIERAAAEAIVAAQMPLADKIARADHLVWNNGTLETLSEQAKLLATLLRATP